MNNNKTDIRLRARLAALLFFIVCVPLATWSLSYVPSLILVKDNVTVTTGNLLSNEFFFRTAIVGHLISSIAFAFMMIVFYQIFSPVNKNTARIMLAAAFAQLAIVLILEVFRFTSLMIIKGDALTAIDIIRRQEYSFLLLRIHRYGIGISQLFWGLCFLPFGMLVYKSRLAPRIFGILLIIGGIGYVADCFSFILLQRSDYLAVWPFIRVSFLGFSLTMLWFVIMSVRKREVIIAQI